MRNFKQIKQQINHTIKQQNQPQYTQKKLDEQQYIKSRQQQIVKKILILYSHYGPNYRAIEFHLSKNQMKSLLFGLRKTISQIISQALRKLEKQGSKFKAINYNKMTSEQHKEVLNLLLSKYNHRILRLTNHLRVNLISFALAQIQNCPLGLQQFIKIYQYLTKWKANYFSGLLRGGKSMRHFSWSKQQIQKLHELYLIYGDNKKQIRKNLSYYFQDQEKYEPSLIHSKLITIFTQPLKRISNQLIKRGSSLEIDTTVTTSKYFICSKEEPQFCMIREILEYRNEKVFDTNKLFELKQFILRFIAKKKIVKRQRSKCTIQLQQPGQQLTIY